MTMHHAHEPGARRGSATIFFAMTLIFLSGLATGPSAPGTVVFIALGGATTGALTWRATRLGIDWDQQRVVVRNVLRTHDLRWDQVRQIDMTPTGALLPMVSPRITTTSGKQIKIDGVASYAFSENISATAAGRLAVELEGVRCGLDESDLRADRAQA